MQEKWKDVPGYESSHMVSNRGRVYSITRVLGSGGVYPGRLLRQWCNNGIHMYTSLNNKRFTVHRLVMLAFVGKCPDGMEVCHNNNNGLDNRLENLRYDTRKNNQLDRVKHGTSNRGVRHGMSKLKPQEVLLIRKILKAKTLLHKEIAPIFKLHKSTISHINTKNVWGWLED